MAYKIRYLPLAVEDIDGLAVYLSRFYPSTVRRVLQELKTKIAKLKDTPWMCEAYSLDPAYRKLVVGDYLVFYQINEESHIVEIHRILRGSWNLPAYLE